MPSTEDELNNLTYPQLVKVFPKISYYKDSIKLTKKEFIDRLILYEATLHPVYPNSKMGTVIIPQMGFVSKEVEFMKELNYLQLKVQDELTCEFPPTIEDEKCKSYFAASRECLKVDNFIKRQVCAVCSRLFPCISNPTGTLQTIEFSNSLFMKIKKSTDIFVFEEFPEVNGFAFALNGLSRSANDQVMVQVCSLCMKQLKSNKVTIPLLSIANEFHYPKVDLPELNFIERQVIARLRLNNCIIKLRSQQNAFKGHYIAKPINPDKLLSILPLPIEEIADSLHVIFVSQKKIQEQYSLRSFPKYFTLSRSKIHAWLVFLKKYNPYYKNVIISQELLNAYPENEFPKEFESISVTIRDQMHADYIAETGVQREEEGLHELEEVEELQSSCILDETGQSMSFKEIYKSILNEMENENRLNHDANTALPIPNDTIAMIEGTKLVDNRHPSFYSYAFPHLFPFGACDPNSKRSRKVIFEDMMQYLLEIESPQFKRDMNFMFHAYDVILHKQLFTRIKFAVKTIPDNTLHNINAIQEADIQQAIRNRLSNSKETNSVNDFMNYSRMISSKTPFCQLNKRVNRQQLKSMIINKGNPTLYLTLSPSDSHNPLAFVLCEEGKAFDLNQLPPEMSNKDYRNRLCGKNPVALASFFHLVIKTILNTLLGGDHPCGEGILGHLKCYYGMVECQCRGTLHVHLLIWLKGYPSPSETH